MKIASRHPIVRRQGGATMIVALIMLLLMTMVALAALNMGKSSLQITGNLQSRSQQLVTANAVSEQAISSGRFFNFPNAVLSTGRGGWSNNETVDVYGDRKTVLNVAVYPVPKCIVSQPIPSSSLVLSNPDDLACSQGQQQNFGVAGSQNGASLCANSTWEVATQATDPVATGVASGTSPGAAGFESISVVQGVSVRIPIAAEATSCP
jgi:hypothetical protein